MAAIDRWRRYHLCLDSLSLDSVVTGAVRAVRPYGLFVDLGLPFVG
ncbi:MAG: hypothetical protein AAFX76_03030 [Planctomycetota bacterium]